MIVLVNITAICTGFEAFLYKSIIVSFPFMVVWVKSMTIHAKIVMLKKAVVTFG